MLAHDPSTSDMGPQELLGNIMLLIDRENSRQHTAFGFGIHRCVGNRLRRCSSILSGKKSWRFPRVEVTGEPVGLASSFIHGIRELPVTLRD
jgi:cytochrome P450